MNSVMVIWTEDDYTLRIVFNRKTGEGGLFFTSFIEENIDLPRSGVLGENILFPFGAYIMKMPF